MAPALNEALEVNFLHGRKVMQLDLSIALPLLDFALTVDFVWFGHFASYDKLKMDAWLHNF